VPNCTSKTIKVTVTVIIARMADYYVQTKIRIENKLESRDLSVTITMGWSMGRGAMTDFRTGYFVCANSGT
jgi:hypothetical protein